VIVVNGPEVVGYVERCLNIKISEPNITFGFMSGKDKEHPGRPLCAVVLNEYNGSNIELTVCAVPGGSTRGVFRFLARYVFEQLGCRRLTARCKARNKYARKMAERVGFKYESVAQRFFTDDDATVLRMFKEDCTWLR
jgi:hypothetical protein